MRVKLLPASKTETGGVLRVISHLRKWLPLSGVEIVEDNPDLIHVHAVAGGSELGDVYTSHGWPPEEELQRRIREHLFNAQVVTAVSRYTMNSIRWPMAMIIPNGWDPDEISMADPGRGRYHVGRFGAKPDYVLWGKQNREGVNQESWQTLCKIAEQMPEVSFVSLAWPATVGPKNIAQIGSLSPQMALSVVAGARMLLSLTKENFPVMSLEALASGVPVASYNHGGGPEALPAEWVVEVGDIVGMQHLIRQFVNEEFGDKARELAEPYRWNVLAQKYVVAYERARTRKELTGKVRVSVVIPAFRAAGTIERAVKSALQGNDVQVVVVDDKSPTNDGALVREMFRGDERVIVHQVDKNVGPSKARNVGISIANGAYCICLDSDDILLPDSIHQLANALDRVPDGVIAYGQWEAQTADGQIHKAGPAESVKLADIVKQNRIPCAAMFRRSVAMSVGGYKKIDPSWEDYNLWIQLLATGGKCVPVEVPFFRYTMGIGGRTGKASGQWQEKRLRAIVDAYNPGVCTGPVVSIVIPCYDHEEFLPDAVQSVMRQSFQKFEIVIVDDCSNGNVRKAISRWRDDPRVRVVRHTQNHGLAMSRNTGVANARGKYILPLDADDRISANFLAATLAKAGDNVLVYGGIQRFNEQGVGEWIAVKFDAQAFYQFDHVPATALYPRQLWVKAGGYDPAFYEGLEDWDFWLCAIENGFTGELAEYATFFYRQHSGQSMRDKMMSTGAFDRMRNLLVEKHSNVYRRGN